MNTIPCCTIDSCRIRLGDKRLSLLAPVQFPAGRVYLVRGASGSGKSSFLRALLGLGALSAPPIQVYADVQLSDRAGRTHPIWSGGKYTPSSRRFIAFLPQAEKLGFIDGLSTMENLRLLTRLPRQAAFSAAQNLSRLFHLDCIPDNLTRASGGERMRLSAIRALLPRSRKEETPVLILADEPASGLDHKAAESLARTLIESARVQNAIVLVVTHETHAFISPGHSQPELPPNEISITKHQIGPDGLLDAGEKIGSLHLGPEPEAGAGVHGFLGNLRNGGINEALQLIGAAMLSPLAALWGLLRLRKPQYVLQRIMREGLAPGTQLFSLTCCTILAATAAIFIFQQMPRSELVEPLLLPELLSVTGQTLLRVVLPMGAACFVIAKLGAAQAAGLSAAVRGGLLETLALARWPVEAFGLVPAVAGQILALAFATFFGIASGLLVSGLIYVGSHPGASLGLALSLMTQDCLRDPRLYRFMLAKVIGSGFIGGATASLFGLCPVNNEFDVGKAVHRTLLWGILLVIAYQCALVVLEYS